MLIKFIRQLVNCTNVSDAKMTKCSSSNSHSDKHVVCVKVTTATQRATLTHMTLTEAERDKMD